MLVRIVPMLALAGVAACGRPPGSIEESMARHLDQVSARVAEVATRAGITVDRSGTVTASRGDGGAAVFVPSPHEDGRLVGWLDLPPANPCAARITPGYYVVEPRLTATEAFLTLREIDGPGGLEGLRSDLERNEDEDALHPGRMEFGSEHFSSYGWVKCSDGIGCCRWVLTLDASTPGCTGM